MKDKKNLLKALGPGILFASTAIGVSHLVQSTQAGANFGFSLLWAVLLANLFKYPFFEYGSRYANVTGTSIIDGYKKLGRPVLWLYFLITIISMFLVTAAVGFVTSGFMQNLFGIGSSTLTTIILFVICGGILISGKFSVLDKLIKVIGIVLLITTILAFLMTLFKGPQGNEPLFDASWLPDDKAGVFFLLGLMGWMPTAVDISSWNSLWTIERMKQTGYKPKLKETLFDFNFGYLASALLSICFVTMGAFILYGTGKPLPNGAAGFASGIIGLYTDSIGEWAYIVIAASAFSIMFGTCIAVFDGYGRALEATSRLLFSKPHEEEDILDGPSPSKKVSNWYIGSVLITIFGGFTLISIFQDSEFGIKGLVNLATTVSFIVAPLVAVFNVLLVRKKYLGEQTPPKWMEILSYLGIIFLTGFSIYFLWIKFGG